MLILNKIFKKLIKSKVSFSKIEAVTLTRQRLGTICHFLKIQAPKAYQRLENMIFSKI